jgi:hypothetical protein
MGNTIRLTGYRHPARTTDDPELREMRTIPTGRIDMTDLKCIESITANTLLTVTGGGLPYGTKLAFGNNPAPGTMTANGWTVDKVQDPAFADYGTAHMGSSEKFVGQFQADGPANDPTARTMFYPAATARDFGRPFGGGVPFTSR